MKRILLPTLDECFKLIDAHAMLPNIREHSLRVMEVAVCLGRELTASGCQLHLPLIETGALLHDLGKTACLGSRNNHAEWGAAILDELGYLELAQVVREHVYLNPGNGDPRPLREAEIVNYADKRVMHDRVVTLETRFEDLKVRYGRTPEALERIAATLARTRALEDKLFAPISITPSDLLQPHQFRRESWQKCG
jgi:uncharacterized protein